MSLTLEHVTKSYDDKAVLTDVSISIGENARIGLIGQNGSGKSTLMKLLARSLQPDSGIIHGTESVGYVPQAPDYDERKTVGVLLSELVKPHETYKVENALTRLGIVNQKNDRFGTLSSGQKTRVYLARLVLDTPDVLLLDEPTNHLDIEALEWLETYLASYKGSVLIISHDRTFLDRIVQEIFELENGKISVHGGNYTAYKEQKLLDAEAHERAYAVEQRTIKRLETSAREVKEKAKCTHDSKTATRDNDKILARFKAEQASKLLSSHAKQIEKRLNMMDRVEKPKKALRVRALFASKYNTPSIVLSCKGLTVERNGHTILNNISFTIQGGERVALLGANGCGKSTIIKAALGELVATSGTITCGPSIHVGYASQDQGELSSDYTALEELMTSCDIEETTAYKLLKKFVLPETIASRRVQSLSSGEKSKLLLAEIMARGANFIILDEPTNHLDIPTREALESALREYDGTLLVISHDRYFLENIGISRQLTLANGILHE